MDHLPCTTEYTERQAFFLVVRIWSSHPLTRKKVLLLPSLDPGGDTLARGGDPIHTKGQTLWYSMYSIL